MATMNHAEKVIAQLKEALEMLGPLGLEMAYVAALRSLATDGRYQHLMPAERPGAG